MLGCLADFRIEANDSEEEERECVGREVNVTSHFSALQIELFLEESSRR